MRSIIWFAAALLLATPASAGDKAGLYRAHGLALEKCATFVMARQSGQDPIFGTWITGYITALNRASENTFDLYGPTDYNGVMNWLEAFCRANEAHSFGDAAEGLIVHLYPTRRQEK